MFRAFLVRIAPNGTFGKHFKWRHFSTECKEIWKDVNGYSNYQVSNLGNVRNKKWRKNLKINYDRFNRTGKIPQVILVNGNGRKAFHVARLVLSNFDPQVEDGKLMYACHLDGDRTNNVLSNLRWSETTTKFRKYDTPYTIPIKLQHANGGTMHFESQEACTKYLHSININIAGSTISRYARSMTKYRGYSFHYIDSNLYNRCFDNLRDEQWKQCHHTESGTRYFVSNKGRIKSRRKNGVERLLVLHSIGGYQYYAFREDGKKKLNRVHTTVALHFVANPHQFQMLDHIDTNVLNNDATNLRWIRDAKQNATNTLSREKISEALQMKKKVQQIDIETGSVLKIWDRPHQIKVELGYHSSNIIANCNGRSKSAYGYVWRFCE